MRRWLVIAIAACAPTVESRADHQRAIDREDSARLAALIETLPGVEHAQVELHRSVVDPFTLHASPASAAIAIVGDRASLAAARDLVRAAAPDVPSPAIAFAAAPPRAEPAREDRRPLAAALALLALAAGYIAWRERPYTFRGSSAQ